MINKKILIIHSSPFFPVSTGSNKVIYEYCNLLKRLGCELHYCSYGSNEFSSDFLDFFSGRVYYFKKSFLDKLFIKNIIRKIRYKFFNKRKVDDLYPYGLERFVNLIDAQFHFDMCIINYIIISKLFDYISIPRKIIYTHDAFTNKLEWLGVSDFWFSLSPSQEAKGIRRCTDVISIQQNESVLFKYYNPTAHVYTVYSPFKISEQEITGNKNILFIAGNNLLNFNGIRNFLENIYPSVLASEPNTKLYIGGSICNSLKSYESTNVILLGKIEEIDNFYAIGDIVINPVYQGTGLKVKTFEALSFGKIVVAHKHSSDGIFAPLSSPILFANNNSEFICLLLEVLTKKNRNDIRIKGIEYIALLNDYIEKEYESLLK